MTASEAITAALGAGALLVAWRFLEGVLRERREARRGLKVNSALATRLDKLEAELTRIPRDPASADDLERLEQALQSVQAQVKTALTQGTAEKLITAHNQIVQDIVALKEWQMSLQQVDGLEEALLNPQPKEKSA
jgi:hypothetical protein